MPPNAPLSESSVAPEVVQRTKNASKSTKRNQMPGPDRAPCDPPPFGVRELRNAIPPHCFQHSYLVSFGYLIWDLLLVGAIYAAARHIDDISEEGAFGSFAPLARHSLWTLYWIVQGSVMTGLWVIGHECGHGGFSASETVNDVVGFIVHTALLVPYFSWKISHRRHHSNTGNMDRDEVFVPAEEDEASDNPLLYTPPVRALKIVMTLTVGWFGYLFLNATGHQSYPKDRWVNHFSPYSPLFVPKERNQIILSDVGLLVAAAVLYNLSIVYGFAWILKSFLMPYFVVNFWLVLITLLQHTDPALPHYRNSEWDWVRGALATVDRDYGILNRVFHHIGDTHVAHHLFHTMPHYHAQEATDALIKVLGPYYRRDDTPIAVALWKCYTECQFVRQEPDGKQGVLWFDNIWNKRAREEASRSR